MLTPPVVVAPAVVAPAAGDARPGAVQEGRGAQDEQVFFSMQRRGSRQRSANRGPSVSASDAPPSNKGLRPGVDGSNDQQRILDEQEQRH